MLFRRGIAVATLLWLAACAGPATAQTVVLSGSVVGSTPATIGFNVGDFDNNNTASWWRYSGVNGGRMFSAPANLTPADTVFKSATNAALDATSQAQFVSQRDALRASGTATTYIRWSTAYTNYTTSASYGNNTIDMEFADATIRAAGGTSLVVMQRTPATYPWPANSSANSAADWQARWLGWQQWYAQAFMRARYQDVTTFQFFNEPDLYGAGLTQSQWTEMMQYGADAVQSAVSDVNRLFGKNLVAKISGPVTNGPSLTPSGTGGDWGDTLLAYRNTPVLSSTAVPGYQLFNQYDYHNYGSSPTTFGTKLEGAVADVNAQTGGQAGQYAFTLSEYNTRTSANYAPNDPVNNPNGYTPDSLAMSSRLGQIDVSLANTGDADGLYLFKFSNAGGANNGVHWQSSTGEVGGATRSAMVHHLFAEGFIGNSLLQAPAISGTAVSLAAAMNATTGTRYIMAANADLAAGKSLTIDLTPWNTPIGSVVTVEQVSNVHQGDISQSLTVGADRTITVEADAGGVVLVRVPSRAGLERTTVAASNDAYVTQGSGNSTFNGPELLVRNSGTSKAQRNVAFLKFPVDVTDPTKVMEAILRIYAHDPGATTSGTAGIITHVYGITTNSWSEGSITWNNAPNLSDPPTTISTIDQNYVGGIGTTSEIIGQFSATNVEEWLSIDVSPWVLGRIAAGASSLSFLIAREIRYDGDVDSSQWLSIRSSEYGDGSFAPQLTLVAVPEPGALALVASAAATLGIALRRRRAVRRPAWLAAGLAAVLVAACLGGFALAEDAGQPSGDAPAPPLPAKKGVGLSERKGKGAKQLTDLGVGWYYNWGAKTEVCPPGVTFVPMIYSARRVDNPVAGPRVLGFNEPDHSKQSDIPVEEALRLWPKVVAKARLVGSPAMAGNPVTGEWLPKFMAAGPKVDFVTLHWYKGPNAKKFIADVEAVHEKYGKPVWVTEFAPQTASSSAENPGKYAQDEVDRFIADVTRWMESTPWVEAYAWHDSHAGTSALFDDQGDLTATGRAYARAGRATDGRMTVVFVGEGKISVRPGNGKDKSIESKKYSVTADTTITIDGKPAALSALKPGHKVVIVPRTDDPGVAASITREKSR